MSQSTKSSLISCPVCNREFKQELIEEHVNKCLFLNTPEQSGCKRDSSFLKKSISPVEKRLKLDPVSTSKHQQIKETTPLATKNKSVNVDDTKTVPLAETMRPVTLNDIVGHKEAFGPGTMLHAMLEQKKVPNMILWGPPGCGKTSLANVVSNMCKESKNMRFVKLSATMAGINDVKEIVKVAKNEAQFKRQTILFMDEIHRIIIEQESLQWLAEVCDGDARIALGALELAITSRNTEQDVCTEGPAVISLEDVKNGIKRTHMLYDRKGEEHYNVVSAIHKSIRASDDNAALYWTTRALSGGEDPLYIARRLVRAACEDIGLADPNALVEAVACLQGCQNIGMPECDVLLAQCAVRLARAEKSREVYRAMRQCQRFLQETKGPLPPIPLHLRNAPTKLMKQLGYGDGYNLLHKEQSGLTYMPSGMEDVDFFKDI
ncbi:hypothetical protein ABMA27_013453 [Loxostege sticticalis]|uniref:Uncharacterized protein n=1 Tax=Loxostege sticticalis TaxID=481309 RepID=A0ABR3IFB3_LOXSC